MESLDYCDTQSKLLLKNLDCPSESSTTARSKEVPNGTPTAGRHGDRHHSTPYNNQSEERKGRHSDLFNSHTSSITSSSDDETSSCSECSSSTTSEELNLNGATNEKQNSTEINGHQTAHVDRSDLENLKVKFKKLQAELKSEKLNHQKTNEKLEMYKVEVETAKKELEMKNIEKNGYGSGEITRVIEEVYRAQQEREKAMNMRMKLAIQEKDEAVLRAKAYMHDITNKEDRVRVDASIRNDINKLIELIGGSVTAREASKYADEVVNMVRVRCEENADKYNEQIQQVIGERDSLQKKLSKAKQELDELKTNKTTKVHRSNSNTKLISKITQLQACLKQSEEDRIKTEKKLIKTEDKLETVRLQYSLERSLKKKRGQTDDSKNDATRLYESLRVANQHNQIQKENSDRMRMKIQVLNETNKKHERHIAVLRRKLASAVEQNVAKISQSQSSSNIREI